MTGGATQDPAAGSAAPGALVHLLSARAVRDFGDGFVAVLLPVYLTMLGFTAFEVGVIATAALLGSALLTLGIGIVGSRHDRRNLLVAGASLMIATGVAFALVHDFALLLVVAFAGTINPSAGSVSIFVPLEHAVLSGAVSDRTRTRTFARYSLIGALSAACGALAAAIPAYPRRRRHGPARGDQGHVRLLRRARRHRVPALRAHPAASAAGEPRCLGGARTLAAHRLPPRRAASASMPSPAAS